MPAPRLLRVIQRSLIGLSVTSALVLAGCSESAKAPLSEASPVIKKKPNILYIMADDLGYYLVGEGHMGAPNDERRGLPGYEGFLNDSSLSFAQLLRDNGYHPYMAGKWHLGSAIAGGAVTTAGSRWLMIAAQLRTTMASSGLSRLVVYTPA